MRVRPDTVSPESWEALTEQEQEFLAEHERLHTYWQDQLREMVEKDRKSDMLAWLQVKHRTVQ